MAGPVRHPVDVKALERYLSDAVPEIKAPVDLKQVREPRDEVAGNGVSCPDQPLLPA
jgi:hypothetical protein